MTEDVRFVQASDGSTLLVVDEQAGDDAGAAKDRAVDRIIAWFRALRDEAPAWLVDLHPAYTSILIEYDPLSASHEDVERVARALAARGAVARAAQVAVRTVEVPVRYGGDDGPDLPDVARHTGLSVDEVIARHAGASYRVAFLGFSPGFAYLLGLPPSLAAPRRREPRALVPAGSVAIGGAQTAVYPSSTPGGWNLIGRTRMTLTPDWVEPGDIVRFTREAP